MIGKQYRFLSLLFYCCFFILFGILFLVVAEIACRVIELKTTSAVKVENISDPVLGWVPRQGRYHAQSSEYDVVYTVNAWGMNDRPVDGLLRDRKSVV